MKHDVALKSAEALMEYLRPACTRIEIAGSIRREKPEVKDIEIVAIPDLSIVVPRARPEFGMPIPPVHKTMMDKLVADGIERGDFRLEPGYPYKDKNGDRMKSFYLNYAGIQCDLFLVLPPATWGVQMLIRTGSADFSHWCVTRKSHGGTLPNGYRVKDGAVWNRATGTPIGFDDEREFMEFLGLGWIEPRDRLARWGK